MFTTWHHILEMNSSIKTPTVFAYFPSIHMLKPTANITFTIDLTCPHGVWDGENLYRCVEEFIRSAAHITNTQWPGEKLEELTTIPQSSQKRALVCKLCLFRLTLRTLTQPDTLNHTCCVTAVHLYYVLHHSPNYAFFTLVPTNCLKKTHPFLPVGFSCFCCDGDAGMVISWS